MYCKKCNLYSDTNECPRCGQLLGNASSNKQEQDRYFYMIQDYCKAANMAFIFGIIAAVLVMGIGPIVAAPFALYFKKKADRIKSSMTMDINDMGYDQHIVNKFFAAQKRLNVARILVKISVILFVALVVLIVSFPALVLIMISVTESLSQVIPQTVS